VPQQLGTGCGGSPDRASGNGAAGRRAHKCQELGEALGNLRRRYSFTPSRRSHGEIKSMATEYQAAHWRARAAEALANAAEVTDPETEETLRSIATGYQSMAERTEKNEAAPRATRPKNS
jgi:hypothetical protein